VDARASSACDNARCSRIATGSSSMNVISQPFTSDADAYASAKSSFARIDR
jgi:hypothetical protein